MATLKGYSATISSNGFPTKEQDQLNKLAKAYYDYHWFLVRQAYPIKIKKGQ